MGEKKQKQMMF